MRPLLLTLSGFGPFSEVTTVDFQTVTDSPLFGIYGPTGSGKTTILDAVAFALFGESSGEERTGEGMRSHFVGADVETYVELLFETGGRRYFLRRSPRQEVYRKRGEGTREQKPEAYLFDATELSPEEVSFPSNAGATLAEKKVTDVSAQIEEIVGFKAAQFRQVVLLPQGRFRELLTADSRDRSDILRRLFGTAVYEQFADRLSRRSSESRRAGELLNERYRTLLEGAGVEDGAELRELIKTERKELIRLQAQRKEAEAMREAASRELDSARNRAQAFREFEEAKEAVGALDERASAMAEREEELDAAERAAEVASLHDRVLESRRQEDDRKRESELRRQTLDTKEAERLAAAEELEGRRFPPEEKEKLRSELEECRRLREEAERLAIAEKELGKLEAEARDAEEAHRLRTGELRVATEEADSLSEAIDDLAALVAEQNQLLQHQERLRRKGSLFERREKQLAAFRRAEAAAAEANNAVATAEAELNRSRERVAAEEARALSAQRRELAETLRPGSPCPVCGSLDHPSPAHESSRSVEERSAGERSAGETHSGAGTDTAGGEAHSAGETHAGAANGPGPRLREAREEERRRQSLLAEAGSSAATTEAERAAAETRLREVEQELSELGGGSAAATREELETVDRRLKAIAVTLKEGEAKRGRRGELRGLIKELQERLAAEEPRLRELQSRLPRPSGPVKELRSRLPQELREPSSISSLEAEKSAELRKREAAEAAAEERSKAAEAAYVRERADLSAAERALRETRERLKEQRKELLGALKEQGFFDEAGEPSEEALLRARRSGEERRTLREELERYRSSRGAAEERRRRAEEATRDLPEPKVPEAEEALRNAGGTLNRLIEEMSRRSERLGRLEGVSREEGELRERKKALEAEFYAVSQLSEIAAGRNEYRTHVVDYVLSVYFDDILAQANGRLSRMSNRRYTLHRKGASGGRGRSGLDIEVYDAFTDRSRDASTLSGGEGFLASLALALGLSDTVQEELGGLHLEVIFIDEGFGHLDEEALEEALNTLDSITGGGRSVGIISHVEEVKRRVSAGFEVVRGVKGSTVRPRRPGVSP